MRQEKIYDVAVIGGGAAGMTAAITAADAGARVVLVEKNPIVGKKILSTGNGRCNFTNAAMDADKFYTPDRGFVQSLLASFDTEDAIQLFRRLGIVARRTPDGYFYPNSNRAKDVRECMEVALRQRGITILRDTSVRKVEQEKAPDDSMLKYYRMATKRGDNSGVILSKTAIIATGGMAAPKSGSTGDGYYFAKTLGHSVVPTHPALVRLICDDDRLDALSGLRVRAGVSLEVDGRTYFGEHGEVQFNADGLSGIPVMSLSRLATVGIDAEKNVRILLNLFPEDLTPEKGRALLADLLYTKGWGKNVLEALGGLLPTELVSVLLHNAASNGDLSLSSACDLSPNDFERLAAAMEGLSFLVTGSKGFDAAQTTAGGIPPRELSPSTLESLLSPGLYFCGEVVDVDGICGGYNLHFAWASGVCTGKAAAKRALS